MSQCVPGGNLEVMSRDKYPTQVNFIVILWNVFSFNVGHTVGGICKIKKKTEAHLHLSNWILSI